MNATNFEAIRAAQLPPFSTSTLTVVDDPAATSPTALSGSYLAHLTDIDPETPVGEALDGDARATFNVHNAARRNIGLTPYDPVTPLGEIAALPIAVADCMGQAPSRREITEWSIEAMEDDPHDLMSQFDAARAEYDMKRARARDDRKAAELQLQIAGVHPRGYFTLETIERIPGVGADVAQRARAMVLKENRRAWSAIKPTFHQERSDLISATELLGFGIDTATVKALTAATDDDEIDAAERLARARKHYAKLGNVEMIDFAGGVVSVSAMTRKHPPRRLLGHHLHVGQPSELIAPSGGGKTFVGIGMGLGLASGKAMDTIGLQAPERARVLYVAAEAPESAYLRVLAWCHHHKVSPAEIDGWFTIYPRPVQLSDPEHMRQVRTWVNANGIALAVFDTRHMVTLGLEENSSTEQGVAIHALGELNSDGCATLTVHHTDKKKSVGDGGRGSGSWFASMYTSMYLVTDDDQTYLVCDKQRDGKGKCKHPLHFADDVCVPEAMMPNARGDERQTRVLAHVDPFDIEPRNMSEPTAKHLATLLVIAENAGFDGITTAKILEKGKTDDNPGGYEIGARPTVSRSLLDLRGTSKTASLPEKYVQMVKERPHQKFRLTPAGWDLLVERDVITAEFAEKHRYTADDVNSPRYAAACENIAAAMTALIDSGEIISGRTQSMTARRNLVQSYMQGEGQEFGLAAWGAVYGRWVDDGWVNDVTTAAKAKSAG